MTRTRPTRWSLLNTKGVQRGVRTSTSQINPAPVPRSRWATEGSDGRDSERQCPRPHKARLEATADPVVRTRCTSKVDSSDAINLMRHIRRATANSSSKDAYRRPLFGRGGAPLTVR